MVTTGQALRKLLGKALCLAAAMALFMGDAADANGLRRPTFQELMADSTLVVIGTVMTVHPRSITSAGWATISVERVLNGEPRQAITIATSSPVAELDPRCCEPGATYIMFLRSTAPDRAMLMSVRGAYGMIRLGAGPPGGLAPLSR